MLSFRTLTTCAFSLCVTGIGNNAPALQLTTQGPSVAGMTAAVPGAPSVDVSPSPNNRFVRSACVTTSAGRDGAFQCNDLLFAHSMAGYRTLDRDRAPPDPIP